MATQPDAMQIPAVVRLLQTVYQRAAGHGDLADVLVHPGIGLHHRGGHVQRQTDLVAGLPCALQMDVAVRGLGANLLAVHRQAEGRAPARNAQRQLERALGGQLQPHVAVPGIAGL